MTERLTIYTQHNCKNTHRTYATFAKCMFPRSASISGEGAFATITYCRELVIQLYPTPIEALAAKTAIDVVGCGPNCHQRHINVQLSLPARWTSE